MINQITYESLKSNNNATIYRAVNYFMKTIGNDIQGVNCWIAGGAIRAYFSENETISDIDIFTTNRAECAKLVWSLRKIGFKCYFKNKNAIKGFIFKNGKKILIDVVKRFYNNEVLCIEDFDYSICKFAINTNTQEFFYSEMAFVDLLQKKLVIPDENYGNPIGSLKRLQKYIQRGYTICNGGLLTISKSLAKTDLTDPNMNDLEFYPDGKYKILFFD